VLVRVAASHLRVGTFEYVSARGDEALLRRLADYAIARHHPDAASADEPYLAFLEAVVDAQAGLVAQWMLAGFVPGVMNTDNMTISGETIDYGPCAFIDAFDPATVFSSIDHAGRYAYGNQPHVAPWNLARFAETLLPLLHADLAAAVEMATAVVRSFPHRFHAAWSAGMHRKLGLPDDGPGSGALVDDLLGLMQEHRLDYTSSLRTLSPVARGIGPAPPELEAWAERWLAHAPSAEAMDRANPVYIPRNHLVEAALSAATAGDLAPFERLVEAIRAPFDERPGLEAYAVPAPESFGAGYQTFCGT
jgi:uncharacterized protein YdiU (UPF0061 family)